MSVFAETRAAVALAAGLRSFLGQRLSVGQARDLIRQRLDRREDHFLGMLEAGVFTVPSSPYRPLLDMAGCSLGDIRASVRTRGIEATLRRLRDEGVYVTFEEFKGRKPIVRRGKAVEAAPSDFFNPLRNTHYWVETGGTTGSAMRVSTDLNRVAVSASYLSIAHHAYGVDGAPKALRRGMLPASAGLNFLLALHPLPNQRQNVGRLRSRGVESEARYRPNSGWGAGLTYLFDQSRVVANPSEPLLIGRFNKLSPVHQFTATAYYGRSGWFNASLAVRCIGSSFEDDVNTLPLRRFSLVDLRVSRPLTERAEAFVSIQNVGDEAYEISRAADGSVGIGAPRLIHAGLRLHF